jgi:hypothetical protein
LEPPNKRVRPASNPYRGHAKLFTTGGGLRDVVVDVVVVVVDVLVNSTSGWETLPGEWSRMNAAVPPSASSRTATATSPHRSRRRERRLGIPGILASVMPIGSTPRPALAGPVARRSVYGYTVAASAV